MNIFGYEITISELVTDLLAIVLFGLYAFRTKGLKNILKELSEMITKFRTMQTVPAVKGQTFSATKDVFRLNKATNELEKTEEKVDLQALIESSLDMALNKVLDRLLPPVEANAKIQEYRTMTDDIDELVKVQNLAEEYRAKYRLPVDYSIEQIFAVVDKKANEIYQKVILGSNDGGVEDETEKNKPQGE